MVPVLSRHIALGVAVVRCMLLCCWLKFFLIFNFFNFFISQFLKFLLVLISSPRKRNKKPGFSVPSFVVHVCVLINNQEKARNSFLGRAFEVLKYQSFDAIASYPYLTGTLCPSNLEDEIGI